jgi:undecaprenyl diphosphate synthase
MEETKGFDRLTVNLAHQLRRPRRNRPRGEPLAPQAENRSRTGDSFSEEDLASCLDNPDMPVIGPDRSVSLGKTNEQFSAWESAYAELYFSPKYWPDWKTEDFIEALLDFQKRVRKYGGTK